MKFLSSLDVSENARQAHNRYMRAWRAKNKQKVNEANLRYWMKRAMQEQGKQEKQYED